MCTKPIKLKPRGFRYLVYSKEIVVPCGDCPECNRKRANDLYVRARMEYDACLRSKGNGFMCCLTYSNDLLHFIDLPDGKKKMVFCKQDCIDFIKRLRTNLDRQYQKRYKENAPDFKYLITSEYGTDPTRSHRPHYHLLFFFRSAVLPNVFNTAFRQSTVCRRGKEKKRYFGFILQCALLDPAKGGIQYSSKYVCKDIMYKPQSDFIKEKIAFYRRMVNNMYGINPHPICSADEFSNSCIRSRKDYKKSVEQYVKPYRHMLQFYMLSNDLGASSTVDKYGENLLNMPTVNFDGFPYSLPKIIKQKFEQKYGFAASQKMVKSAFLNYLRRGLSELVDSKFISGDKSQDLIVFASAYCQPYKGKIKLILPNFDPLNDALTKFKDWKDIIEEFKFYQDNDFFKMRDDLERCISLFNRKDMLKFRFDLVTEKARKEKEDYERKKRNKNV